MVDAVADEFTRKLVARMSNLKVGDPLDKGTHFGPLSSEEAAVHLVGLAIDSPYGLGGSVFTADIERGKRVADQIDPGMVFINHPTWTAPALPFGGVKRSRFGRELSGLGVEELVNRRLICVSALNDPF